jgi:plasmid stabilization system protein ParE
MRPRRLEWSFTAVADLRRITDFYAETAGMQISEKARVAIERSASSIAAGVVTYRKGRRGTRECVLDKFPYIIIYRTTTNSVRIVRVLHQARDYFNA